MVKIIFIWSMERMNKKEMAQDALNRFWWPSIMMFGPQGFYSSRTGNVEMENKKKNK